jgi:hypothetical protein
VAVPGVAAEEARGDTAVAAADCTDSAATDFPFRCRIRIACKEESMNG